MRRRPARRSLTVINPRGPSPHTVRTQVAEHWATRTGPESRRRWLVLRNSHQVVTNG